MIYWSSTILITAFLFFSSYTYLFSERTIEGIKALGFPDFFRVELAALKIIAAVLLLSPTAPLQIKEWSYAGVGLFLITALIAHIKHKDSIFIVLLLLVLFGALILSNIYMHKSVR